MVINVLYFNFFSGYLHFYTATNLFNEGMGAITSIKTIRWGSLSWILIDLPFLLFLIISVDKNNFLRGIFSFKPITIGFFLLTSFFIYLNTTDDAIITQLNSPHKSESAVIKRYGVLVNMLCNIFRFNKEDKIIADIFTGDQKVIVSDRKYNVVVIQVESLFSDVIEITHNGKHVAPFLFALSKKCTYYPYCLTMHNAGGTSDCEFSTITSSIPPSSFPGLKLTSYDYPNSFLKILSSKGYVNIAFHANDRGYFNRDIAFPKMGFDHFYDIIEMKLPRLNFGAPDEHLFNFAGLELHRQKKPFCSYLITISSHAPFEQVRGIYTDSNLNDISDKVLREYLNAVSYVDSKIKIFFDSIQDIKGNTIIFVIGDHPINIPKLSLNSLSIFYDNRGFNFVPLLIVSPDSSIKFNDTFSATTLDIAPTILGATVGGKLFTQGENLLDTISDIAEQQLNYYGKNYTRGELRNIVDTLKNKHSKP